MTSKTIDFKKKIFSFCPGGTLDNSPAIDCRELNSKACSPGRDD